jgi:hypothetical protein
MDAITVARQIGAITMVPCALLLYSVNYYFWVAYRDYYFPHLYEHAFGAMFYAIAASVLALATVITVHLVQRLRARSNSQPRSVD